MMKHLLTLFLCAAITTVAGTEQLKTSQLRNIAAQYAQAIVSRDFNAWSGLMLDTQGIDEKEFIKRVEQAVCVDAQLEDIDKTKYGYDLLLKFSPRVVITSDENRSSSKSTSTYWVQLLPNGKIKYDILIPHPVPFAMTTCMASIMQLEQQEKTESGAYLKNYEIPLFDYDPDAPASEQKKALKKIKHWLLTEGKDWDRTDPKIPCPKELYKAAKDHVKLYT